MKGRREEGMELGEGVCIIGFRRDRHPDEAMSLTYKTIILSR